MHSTTPYHVAVLLLFLTCRTMCDAQATSASSSIIPPYVRGPGYEYILSEAARQNGLSSLTSAVRMRIVMDKLMRGIPIRLAALGASIMAGQGTHGRGSLPTYIFQWFEDQFPGLVNCTNGALGGITSQYMSVCHNMHVVPDADLIIVDFTISDGHGGKTFQDESRRSFERLIRTLLSYPKRPAVVLIHAFTPHQFVVENFQQVKGRFWNNAERDYGEYERYYQVPSVSVKSCCYHYFRENSTFGFNTEPRWNDHPPDDGSQFFYDTVHPGQTTGCRVMAELLFHLVTKVVEGLKERPLTDYERTAAAAVLPAPMIPGNHEAGSTRCFIGNAFTQSIMGAHEGWEWVNESKTQLPKWGFISTTVGAVVRFLVDTRAPVSDKSHGGEQVLVQLSHLKSYQGMGEANITCEGGCVCKPTIMQGHHDNRNSLSYLHAVSATMAANCVISVMVLNSTLSSGHKVKLMGIVVSDETGTNGHHIGNNAIHYVHDVALKGGGGSFDVKNIF